LPVAVVSCNGKNADSQWGFSKRSSHSTVLTDSIIMRLSFGLEARQIQTQKLAPRMIQSMEILQLPILALQERIEQEMNENPMLEVEERDETLPDEEPTDEENPSASRTEDEKELIVKDSQSNAEDFERLANMDNDMPDTFDDFRRSSSLAPSACRNGY